MQMNIFSRKPYLLTMALVAGVSLFIFLCYYYSTVYHEKIRAHPEMYCYDTFRGPVNSALYIASLSDSADYLHYYREVQIGRNPVIGFPLNGLNPDVLVYVQGYLGNDSSLAEVVSYDSDHPRTRSYFLRCYVYRAMLHTKPPAYER
jgi:hypothetical protein